MKILVHCSILVFLDFWHEGVLNFILAEKENQKVLFNPVSYTHLTLPTNREV